MPWKNGINQLYLEEIWIDDFQVPVVLAESLPGQGVDALVPYVMASKLRRVSNGLEIL